MKMNKILLLILLFAIYIPFNVRAETCDDEKIKIESITVEDKSDSVVEVSEPTVEDDKIKLNLDITNVGDSVSYKIEIKNDSEEDYKLDERVLGAISDYIDYDIEYEDEEGIIKGASTTIIHLNVTYNREVPDTEFTNGKLNDDKTLKLSMVSEAKEEEARENPNTIAGKYIVIIVAIVIFSGIVFIIMRKTRVMKYFVLVAGLTAIIPIYVKAMCNYELSIEAEITLSQKIICKRATSLKTERCVSWDYGGQCYYAGYYSGGAQNTDIITFGNLGTAGELNTGDAFVCDVNGDENFDEDLERFYYVTDYYDTVNNTFDESTAILIFDSNTTNGERNMKTYHAYSETADVTDGPTEGVKHLPTTEQWPNVELKETNRQLRKYDETTTVGEKELGLFDYSGRAARLITWQEMKRACDMNNSQINYGNSIPSKCYYLFSNLAFSNRANKVFSHWTETIYSVDKPLMIYSFSIRVTDHYGNDGETRSVRPVIDVPKKNILYR